jgi:hypothetical protein
MQTKFIIFMALVVLIVGGTGAYFGFRPEKPGELDSFAQCIKSSGAEFYGAFWCAHCQEQKKDFGSSKKYLPYVECANPDNSQTQICIDKKITGYPTWIFADGTSLPGRLPFETLAEKTQCMLP